MWRWPLILICFVAAPMAAHPGEGDSAPLSAKSSNTSWPTQVPGYGLTTEEAKNDALQAIVDKLAAALRHQDPPLLAWQPTTTYVKRHVIRDKGHAEEDFVEDGVRPRKTWIYPVKPLDRPALGALDQEAQRLARRGERDALGNHVFGAVALILAVLMGYLRLDDWTGGRYRGRLQMAGGAILVVAGIVLWRLG